MNDERSAGPARALEFATAIEALLEEQANWQLNVLNLSPAEGLMSKRARSALASDLASRLSEGPASAKDPSMPASMHRWAVQLETSVGQLAGRLFNAVAVDCRPLSNTMANAMALAAVTTPGDTIAVQSLRAGGNLSYQAGGICAPLGLRVVELPGTPDFRLAVPESLEVLDRTRPRAVVVGGSKVLYPYGVEAVREACEAIGAVLLYDAAHVAPFIAAQAFENPLSPRGSMMTLGTHKLMGGPVGGLILTNDADIHQQLRELPETWFMQTRDLNKYAAAAISLAEMTEYSGRFVKTVRANVAAFGAGLRRGGWSLVGETDSLTHMVIADLGEHARDAAHALVDQGVLVGNTALFSDGSGRRSGVRMSMAQLTRRGAGPEQAEKVADLACRAVSGDRVSDEVRELAGTLQRIHFSFDD